MSDGHQFAESGGGSRSYHFIPATAKDELRLVQEVLTLALTGKSSQDADVWVHPETGEMQVTPPRGVGTVQEWQSSIQRRVIASLAITNALKESDLRALVQSKDGMLHRIDRMYWLRTNVGAAEAVCQFDGMVPSTFVGQPILADLAELNCWRDVAEIALSAMMPNIAAPLTAVQPVNVRATPTTPKRRFRSSTSKQRRIAKFLDFADKQNWDGLTHDQLFADYASWNVKQNKASITSPVDRLEIAAFKKWRKRWRDGERWT